MFSLDPRYMNLNHNDRLFHYHQLTSETALISSLVTRASKQDQYSFYTYFFEIAPGAWMDAGRVAGRLAKVQSDVADNDQRPSNRQCCK